MEPTAKSIKMEPGTGLRPIVPPIKREPGTAAPPPPPRIKPEPGTIRVKSEFSHVSLTQLKLEKGLAAAAAVRVKQEAAAGGGVVIPPAAVKREGFDQKRVNAQLKEFFTREPESEPKRAKVTPAGAADKTRKQPHGCHKCSYRAAQLESLDKHVRYKHLNEPMPHACDKCDYRALSKNAVLRHDETKHQRLKKYKCKVTRCGFAGIYQRNLNLHVKKVHGEQTTKKVVKKTVPPVQIKIIKSEIAPIAETITGDLDEYESDDSIEILSEVGSAFVGTPSGSSSETLTTATSSEDGFYKGPEIALETPPLSRAEGEITPCKNNDAELGFDTLHGSSSSNIDERSEILSIHSASAAPDSPIVNSGTDDDIDSRESSDGGDDGSQSPCSGSGDEKGDSAGGDGDVATRVASSILDGVLAEVGVAEEIASAILCDLVRSVATESPELVCLEDDDGIEVLGEVSKHAIWSVPEIIMLD